MQPVPGAGTGLFPLDDELELLPGTLTPWLQASLVRLGSWMPFAHAARELGWLSRAPDGALASESGAERLTEAAGAAYVAEQTAAVEALEQRPTPEPAGPAVLQMSADGAMISLVGKRWVEVKTLAIGTIVRAADGTVRAEDPCTSRAVPSTRRSGAWRWPRPTGAGSARRCRWSRSWTGPTGSSGSSTSIGRTRSGCSTSRTPSST